MFCPIVYVVLTTLLFEYFVVLSYSRQATPMDHAKVVRQLVHQANWAAVGTLSTSDKIEGFPMVNLISVADMNGKIRFMLTDLDFTSKDSRQTNKVTFFYTDEQNKNCAKIGRDPMDPRCRRTIISGKIVEIDKNETGYTEALAAFIERHPTAVKWQHIPKHHFYLAELDIEHIFVLDDIGPPKEVNPDDYYSVNMIDNELIIVHKIF